MDTSNDHVDNLDDISVNSVDDMKEEEKYYHDFTGSELKNLKNKEREAGFRHHLRRVRPSKYTLLKEKVWRFSTDERSSIPVSTNLSTSILSIYQYYSHYLHSFLSLY